MIATAVMWYSIALMHSAEMACNVEEESDIPPVIWFSTLALDFYAYYRITEVFLT